MPEPTRAIIRETDGDVTIIRFTADQLKEGEYLNRASDELKKFALRVGGKVLVDLGNVLYMSSPGVAVLIMMNKALRMVRGELKLCNVKPFVSQILRAAGIDKALEIHATKAEAMAAFRDDPEER